MRRIILAGLAAGLVLIAATAGAADVAGSRDPAFLKRYEGSEIIKYTTRSYDRYLIAEPDPESNNKWKFAETEGQITRILYHEPPGHSVLELMRNYEQALKEVGLTQKFELSHGIVNAADFATAFWGQGVALPDNPFYWSSLKNTGYLTASGTREGQDVTVAVFFCEYLAQQPITLAGVPKPIDFAPGELSVAVDIVSAKAVENKMVTVKTDDLAKALKDTGKVDIYGITFDVDKSDIKPESAATLEQVAKLLKDDPALKLEVAGHTDSTGGAEHNLKLSDGRAAAVVQALVKTYGIDAARLQGKGYGDTKPVAGNDSDEGRAKNRRVELRKI